MSQMSFNAAIFSVAVVFKSFGDYYVNAEVSNTCTKLTMKTVEQRPLI